MTTAPIQLNVSKTEYKPEVKQNYSQPKDDASLFEDVKTGFIDWINGDDKVCTDGKDDGKLSFGETATSFLKGLGGIVKTAINHPIATGLTFLGGVALTVATGGAALPALVAIGAGTGVVQVGYGAYKAVTAETDAEAKQAWETMGNGAFALGTSVLGAKGALKTATKAGVAIDKADDLNALQATVQCFKSAPNALKTSAVNTAKNIGNVINPGYVTINGKTQLVNGRGVQSATDGIKVMTQQFDDLRPDTRTFDVKNIKTDYATTAIQGSSLDDGASAALAEALSEYDTVTMRDWGTWQELGEVEFFVQGRQVAKISNFSDSSISAMAYLSSDVSVGSKALGGLVGVEAANLKEDEE